jgi:undecaprenyl-diphosphatase
MSVLVIALLLLAFSLFAEVAGGKFSALDQSIMLALRNPNDQSVPIGPAWLRDVARDVTSLGSTIVLGTITFTVEGYLLLAREFATASLMIIALLGGLALNNILKLAFARSRPTFIVHETRFRTTSFPSGHATMSTITYLTIGTLLARTHPSFAADLFFICFAVLVSIFVGISRIYLGVHYLTDILAGWCIGTAWAMFCWQAAAWLQTAS